MAIAIPMYVVNAFPEYSITRMNGAPKQPAQPIPMYIKNDNVIISNMLRSYSFTHHTIVITALGNVYLIRI